MKENKLKKLISELNKYRYKCKQWCYSCCTWINFLPEEFKLMQKELRKQWYTTAPNWKWSKYCEYLTIEWKCSVYNARPIVCRSFSNYWFLMRWNWKTVVTQTCIYWEKKIVIASKEFIEYWKEVLEKWMYNKNANKIMQDFINSKPLFDIPKHLK